MKILKSTRFREELKEVVKHIALDSKPRAYKFNQELSKSIKELSFMPYKFRQSTT